MLTIGLCAEGWYSEHTGVSRKAELPGRSVDVDVKKFGGVGGGGGLDEYIIIIGRAAHNRQGGIHCRIPENASYISCLPCSPFRACNPSLLIIYHHFFVS